MLGDMDEKTYCANCEIEIDIYNQCDHTISNIKERRYSSIICRSCCEDPKKFAQWIKKGYWKQ